LRELNSVALETKQKKRVFTMFLNSFLAVFEFALLLSNNNYRKYDIHAFYTADF
jgi:hypothetical protein